MLTKKRGQVTIFIILAIVIVVILGTVIYVVMRSDSSLGSLEQDRTFVEGQLSGVQSYIKSCGEETVSNYVPELLKNGGKNSIEPHALTYYGGDVNYLVYESQNKMNLRVEIERRISEQVEQKLKDECSLGAYDDINPKTQKRDMEVETLLLDDSIKVSVNYPIVFKKGKYQTEISDYSFSVDSSFGRLYRVADTITNREVNGEFDAVSYMMTYPDINIKKDSLDLDNKVYVINLEGGKEYLIFATGK